MSKYIHTITVGLLIGVLGFGFEEILAHHPRLSMVVAGAIFLSAMIIVLKGTKHDR